MPVTDPRQFRASSRNKMRNRVSWLCPLVALLLSGCNDTGFERVVVSGAVTYKGEPVRRGEIRFMPDANSHVPMSGAYIVDGQYLADAKGGVPVGTFNVEIQAFRGDVDDRGIDSRTTGATREQYLPAKYNTQSVLTLSLDSADSAVTKDFELQ